MPVIALAVGIFYGLPLWFENAKIICARYPVINIWFQQLGLFWESNRFNEAFYRIIPMLGTFAIGYFVLWILRKKNVNPIASIIAATAFAVTPPICFHSTILYLEIPATVLIIISMYYIEELLTADFESAKAHPAWLALITLGFIKETVFAILFTIIVLRIIVRGRILYKSKQLNSKTLALEAGAIFCIALPLFFYLICRTQFAGNPRAYRFAPENLFHAARWKLAGLAMLDQYAPILAIAILGTVIGIYKKRNLWAGAIWIVFAAHFLFHFMGRGDLVGYARFQIFLLGPLAVPAIYALVMLAKRRQLFCTITAVIILTVNIWLCPVDVFSGGRKPGWAARGNRYYSERCYPYRQAIQWLKQNHRKTPMIIGSTNPNGKGFSWTCKRYQFQPNAKFVALVKNKNNKPEVYVKNLKKILTIAAQYRVPLVMLDKKDDTTIIHDDEKSLYGYTAFKIISNKYQSVIFYRPEQR